MGGKKKKGSKATGTKRTDPPSLNALHSPQSRPAELKPIDAHSDSESILNPEERITHDEAEEIEANQQELSARMVFDTPVNAFDEMRDLDSTSAWALDSYDSNTSKIIAAQLIPQLRTPTLSDSADTRSNTEGDGVSENTVATVTGEPSTEKPKTDGTAIYSEKAFRELQTRFEKMKQDLGKKTRDLKSAQHNAATAREETAKVKANHSKEVKEALKTQREQLTEQHKNYVSNLETSLTVAHGVNMHLTKRSEDRLKKLHKSADKVKLLLEEQSKHVTIMQYQKAEIAKLKIQRMDIWDMFQAQRLKKWHYRGELEIMEKNMNLELKKREPLIRIGAAVRMRFMEQAKYILNAGDGSVGIEDDDESSRFGFPNRSIIEKGNDAAHDGDSEADAALFKLDYYNTDEDEWGSHYRQNRKVYFTLYKVQPEMFNSHDNSHYVRILDCYSTIRALNPTNQDNNFENGRKMILTQLGDILRQIREDGHGDRFPSERGWFQNFCEPKDRERYIEVNERMTRTFVESHRRRW